MAISNIMEVGKNALLANMVALQVTGNNITNVNTDGYSRQTAQLTEMPGFGRFNVSSGVYVSSVTRTYDDYLQTQMKNEASNLGYYQAQNAPLSQLDQLFNGMNDSGVVQSLQDFFNSYQDLANNTTGVAERQAVLASANTLVEQIHRAHDYVVGAQNDANLSLQSVTQQINTITSRIASLNNDINLFNLSGENPNSLLDQRDQLVRDLATQVSVNYKIEADGTASVTLASGQSLVTGIHAATFSLQANAANNGYSDVILTQAGGAGAVNVTSALLGPSSRGALSGILTARDKTLSGVLGNLDEFAYQLAQESNSIQTAAYGSNGSTGLPLFSVPAAPVPPALYPAGYSGSAGIKVLLTNAADVAASSTDPTAAGGGVGNNKAALALADLSQKKVAFSTGNNTMSDFFNSMMGSVGVSVQGVTTGLSQSTAVNQQLAALRESQSGVSMDEELAKLMAYQKSFQAAAQLITVGSEMLDTVLGMLR